MKVASKLPPLRDRAPAVTVVLLEADASDLSARLVEVAAQDYSGPLETIVVAARDARQLGREMEAHPWARAAERPAEAGEAVELAVGLAGGVYLAILPRSARPHPLWIEELVAAAVARPDAFAVAPSLSRPGGTLVAAGAERANGGPWRARPQPAASDAADTIEAAVGDGLLVAVAPLRGLFPLDRELDARALGIDLCLRAKARGLPVVLAPRARVVVPGSRDASNGRDRVEVAERSSLLLTATYQSDALGGALGALRLLAEAAEGESAALVREALRRAGFRASEPALAVFLAALRRWAKHAVQLESASAALGTRVATLEREGHEQAIVLHREMAWAHELNGRHEKLRIAHDQERARAETAEGRGRELDADLGRTRDHLRRETERANGLAADLASTAARLRDVEIALAEERTARAAAEARAARAEEEAASLRVLLDETSSALVERRGDLARLRARTTQERDAFEERVVRLLEEVSGRRFFARKLRPDERSFLASSGARFLSRPLSELR
ncbi:MAG TPA: hypothetical protein VKE69_08285 [Planctomycetota bacterium]|nr:hypothetical protein [Planctomycetota bacterium]